MRQPVTRSIDLLTSSGGKAPPEAVKPMHDARIDDRAPEAILPEHRTVVMLGLEASRRGEVAADEEVSAVFASFRR